MKIRIDIDCTPEEARTFLGLPDIVPVQERVMAELEQRLMEALTATDPEVLLERWMPVGIKDMEQWQTLWTEMLRQATGLGGAGGGAGGERGGKAKR
jgi:hypothetical protein